MSERKKIALFIGADLTAHVVLNRLVDDMLEDYEPIIFMPKHVSSTKADLPELKQFAFYDRQILSETVYPFIENENSRRIHAPNRSPNTIAKDEGLRIEYIDNVNDPAFISRLRGENNLAGAISIRCFQIFQPPIIDMMNQRGFFLNLHPGVLPQYRGVMSAFRALAAKAPEHGWTLHKVEKEIDAGEILWVKAKPLDSKKSGYSLNVDIASIGAQSIMRALDELKDGNILKGYPQNPAEATYYTYPTADELQKWKKKGISLIDPEEVTKTLVDTFSHAGTSHARELSNEIKRAIRLWELENPTPQISIQPVRGHKSPSAQSHPVLAAE